MDFLTNRTLRRDRIVRVFFVRHGEIQSNISDKVTGITDEGLTVHGKDQVLRSAKILKECKIDHILTSPLYRTVQTANLIGIEIDLQPVSCEDLKEIDFGLITGLTPDEILSQGRDSNSRYIEWMTSPDQTKQKRPDFFGGETFEEVKSRIQRFTHYVNETFLGKSVIAVSHGGYLKSLMHQYAGGTFDRSIPFWFENASISVVDFIDSRPMIRLVNYTTEPLASLSFVPHRIL